MILKKLTIENFRQFYGCQTIEFSNEANNNITVVKGENGCGKTGIYRAMIFCLYGEKCLTNEKKTQGNDDSEQVHLINFNYLDENKDKVVSAIVTLEISNQRNTYIIKRKIDGKKNSVNDEIKENNEPEVEMQIIDEVGNFSPNVITDKNEVKRIVNDILDSGLKDFFFFDGEQIENLSKTDKEMREAIKNGITKLLQIDNLETAIRITDSIVQNQRRNIKNSNPNSELSKLLEEIENIKTKITEKQTDLDNTDQKIAIANDDINSFDEKLQKNENIKQIYEKIRMANTIKNAKKENLQQSRELLAEICRSDASFLLLDSSIANANKLLNDSVDDTELVIPEDKLDTMLSEGKCLCCGRNFDENDVAHTYISQLKLLQEKITGKEDVIALSNDFQGHLNKSQNITTKFSDFLDKIESHKEEIEEQNKVLQNLNSEVSNSSMKENDLASTQMAKDNREKAREELIKQKAIIENEIEKFNASLAEKEDKKEALNKAKTKEDTEIEKLQKLEALLALYTTIKDKYSLKMREKLSHESTEIFRELISDKDKNLISKIEIGEKYEIIVKGWDNTSCLQDISSGQRQIVSLAVIVGLADIACNNTIDIPLFMDTPFGRVSRENRSRIIESLSKKVGQWILLMTDTEMTKFEYDELMKTNNWGKLYILDDGNVKGMTKIIEKDKDLYEPQKESVGDDND